MALLDRVQRAREMQIFIGHESDLSPGGDVSLVATPYGRRIARWAPWGSSDRRA
jgi:heat-inducible transcriptional repressor